MTEIKSHLAYPIKVNNDNESDFKKLYEDYSEEEFFLRRQILINEDNHKLVV